MPKRTWKAGTMLYPVPSVMVSCAQTTDSSTCDEISIKKKNIITIAWTGIICSDPPMLYISVRPERYSHSIIKNSGEFVVNIPNKKLAFATDFCGVKSGRDIDKFEHLNLHAVESNKIKAPYIDECPVNIECKVKEIVSLGSHDMFISEICCVNVDESLLDENDKLHLDRADLICYSHGEYWTLKESVGHFGYSIRKKEVIKRERKK